MGQQPEVYSILFPFLGCAFDLYYADYRGMGRSHNLGNIGCIDEGGINATGCAASAKTVWGGDLLAHFSVTNIARDFNQLIPQFKLPGDEIFTLGYSWGTYVSNRLLQLIAQQAQASSYLSGMVLDAVCTPGLCKALNIGVDQDRAGRMLLSRYCAQDPYCVDKLGGDPEHFAADVYDRLASG
jgi:pimeloyl-ACP methyl ester carboxylesterase